MTSPLRHTLRIVTLALLLAAGAAQAATYTLWAKPGTIPAGELPGITTATTIWGFASSATAPATVPGPMVSVAAGEVVTVDVVNLLPDPLSLSFPGQAVTLTIDAGTTPARPDTLVLQGKTGHYTFTASAPGTYLYEAGLAPGTQHQAPMGLYGALVVLPTATGQAYDDPATAFHDEAVVVLSELDTTLNGSASPAAFDLRNYAPRYYLLNGRPYPRTAPIATAPGHKVLLRYLNAGLQHHSMSLLGLTQTVIAVDGNPRAGQPLVAETIAPGQTLDALVTIPALAPSGGRFALYDASLKLHNGPGFGTTAGIGGMLTFLSVGAAPAGPTTSGVAALPNPATGSLPVTVTATVTAVPPATVTAAEYFLDAPGASGTGTTMTGTFGGASTTVTATLSAAAVAALANGAHTFYVHGQDSTGAWGAFSTGPLAVQTGPIASQVAIAPNPSAGSAPVTLTALLTGTATVTVSAAEYYLDSTGGTGVAMAATDGAFGGASEQARATIATSGLTAGNHAVYVRGRTGASTWGAFAPPVTLSIDRGTGPVVTSPLLSPNPTNGVGIDVALTATGDDRATGGSNVTAAEYFLGPAGAAGTGLPMALNLQAPVAALSATILAATVSAQTTTFATVTVSIRARDAAGNWGPVTTTSLLVDKVGPTTTAPASLATNGATDLRISVTVSDAASGGSAVTAAEGYFEPPLGAPPGASFPLAPSGGGSFYADIPVATLALLASAPHTIQVRGKDAAGNWGALAVITLVIDKVGPVASAVTLTPAAANNTAVTVTAQAVDALSNVAGGELFVNTVGAPGTGIAMTASPAAMTATLTGTIPAGTVAVLQAGNRTVYVRARDAAGNWGGTATGTLLVDRTPPTFSGITLTPGAIPVGAASVALAVNGANDPLQGGLRSGVAGGEYWFGAINIGAGTGTAFSGTSATIPTASLAAGSYTVRVRIRDVAGNWSTGNGGVRTATLTVIIISAVADARTVTANTNPSQTIDSNAGSNLLANDQPGGGGRTAVIASAPTRTAGAGPGTPTVTCPGSLGSAAPGSAIGGNAVCTNGAYRLTLTGTQAAKRGTYQFTYRMVLNGVQSAPATVTITVQ